MTNTIQKRTKESMEARPEERATMQQYIRQMQGEIKKALPSVMTKIFSCSSVFRAGSADGIMTGMFSPCFQYNNTVGGLCQMPARQTVSVDKAGLRRACQQQNARAAF